MPTLTEAQAEPIADARVWDRLRTDAAYRNAENAEEQAAREDEIGEQVWRELEERYEIR